jgi:hypothetical protein
MDSRHEFYEQEILNKIITELNFCLKEKNEEIIQYTDFSQTLKSISNDIYRYLEMDVEVDAILANKNLLSIDVVPFPLVESSQASTNDKEKFNELIVKIKTYLTLNSEEKYPVALSKSLERIENILLNLEETSKDINHLKIRR